MSDRKMQMVMALIEHGPMTRNEVAERLGCSPHKVGEISKALKRTKPFNLVYVCDYKRGGKNNYPMAVFDLNLTGKPMADEPRPAMSRASLRYQARKAAGTLKTKRVPSAPDVPSSPVPPSAASPGHSQPGSPRPNPEHRPVASIWQLARTCTP